MSGAYSLARAARWLLHSGIQEPSGGVARYHLADTHQNKPISTEITGYFASAMVFLYQRTGTEEYLDAACRATAFLCEQAWDPALRIFPFELPPERTFFFDSGIILRGLLAVWGVTKEERLLEISVIAAYGMISDFRFEPILTLPQKKALPREGHWSRSPGCYQLKAALAWWELSGITGDGVLGGAYYEALDNAVRSHGKFLPGSSDKAAIMDRLHPYLYFLEGLTPVLRQPEYGKISDEGCKTVERYLREIEPEFVRSDVHAQLLRVGGRTCREALMEFQTESGAFLFGRRMGQFIPHESPVSTIFAIQALEHDSGSPI